MGSNYIDNTNFEKDLALYAKAMKGKKPINPDLANRVADQFYLLSHNIVQSFGFSLIDYDDAKQDAVMVCLRKMNRFEPEKGKAFNYFTTMILNHFRSLHRRAFNYRELKKKYRTHLLMSLPPEHRHGEGNKDSNDR